VVETPRGHGPLAAALPGDIADADRSGRLTAWVLPGSIPLSVMVPVVLLNGVDLFVRRLGDPPVPPSPLTTLRRFHGWDGGGQHPSELRAPAVPDVVSIYAVGSERIASPGVVKSNSCPQVVHRQRLIRPARAGHTRASSSRRRRTQKVTPSRDGSGLKSPRLSFWPQEQCPLPEEMLGRPRPFVMNGS
jgi:hypothetical protein